MTYRPLACTFDGAFHGPRRAARADEDALPVWGQGLGPAAELPLGAELYVSAGNPANRVFDRVTMALRAAKGDEDAGAGKHETSSTGDLLSPVFFSHPNRVFNGVPMALRATEMVEDAWSGKARNR